MTRKRDPSKRDRTKEIQCPVCKNAPDPPGRGWVRVGAIWRQCPACKGKKTIKQEPK